jgi:hypothetical protein
MEQDVSMHFILPQMFLFTLVFVVLLMAYLQRSRREKHRVELQKAILDRVGSVKDLAEFMTTEQGERFLAALAPAHFQPYHRGLWSVRIGVILLTIGLFLMVAVHSSFFGPFAGNTPPRALLMGSLLLVAAGIGTLLSAAVSFVIARSLLVFDRRGNGSKKDHAV